MANILFKSNRLCTSCVMNWNKQKWQRVWATMYHQRSRCPTGVWLDYHCEGPAYDSHPFLFWHRSVISNNEVTSILKDTSHPKIDLYQMIKMISQKSFALLLWCHTLLLPWWGVELQQVWRMNRWKINNFANAIVMTCIYVGFTFKSFLLLWSD